MLQLTDRHKFNPLRPHVQYSGQGKFHLLWSWTPRMTPRSSVTHAPWGCIISTDPLISPKISNFIKNCCALIKGLKSIEIII